MSKERTKLKKKLDALVSRYVRARDRACVCCGKTEHLQCGHLLTRRWDSTRWSSINCNTQCAKCNSNHRYHPEVYTAWFLNKYSEQVYRELVKQHHTVADFKIADIRQLIKQYEDAIAQL